MRNGALWSKMYGLRLVLEGTWPRPPPRGLPGPAGHQWTPQLRRKSESAVRNLFEKLNCGRKSEELTATNQACKALWSLIKEARRHKRPGPGC